MRREEYLLKHITDNALGFSRSSNERLTALPPYSVSDRIIGLSLFLGKAVPTSFEDGDFHTSTRLGTCIVSFLSAKPTRRLRLRGTLSACYPSRRNCITKSSKTIKRTRAREYASYSLGGGLCSEHSRPRGMKHSY